MKEMDEFTFYYLKGIRGSEEAKKLLDEAGIDYKMVVLDAKHGTALMVALHGNLDFKTAPVLYRPRVQAEGIEGITSFINKYFERGD